jgi:type III pantothenate kinase
LAGAGLRADGDVSVKELLAIDIGNTNVKLGWFSDGDLVHQQSHPVGEIESAASATLRGSNCPVAYASVAPAAEATLLPLLGERTIIVVNATVQNWLTGMDPTMGSDRVADSVAAWKIYGNGRPVAVIGLGTATTMLVISAAGHVLGGFIAPGLNLALASLHQHTALLPLLTMDLARENADEMAIGAPSLVDATLALGWDTNSHMLHGVFSGHLGLIRQWLELARERVGADLFSVVTGGFSRSTLFTQANEKYKLFDTVDPQLTLKGIALVATVFNENKGPSSLSI